MLDLHYIFIRAPTSRTPPHQSAPLTSFSRAPAPLLQLVAKPASRGGREVADAQLVPKGEKETKGEKEKKRRHNATRNLLLKHSDKTFATYV
jgi:hypothetical protein